MLISVVIPAFNEGDYLGQTLASLDRAKALLRQEEGISVETIVVDNNSLDATAAIARDFGAIVVVEIEHNVAKVRNTGARFANGDILVFIDADTIVPGELLRRIAEVMTEPTCFGGAVDTNYRPAKLTMKIYLQFWRIIGKLVGMAQGATQFCRKEAFFALKGYDETLLMGEDVDYYWRMKRFAKRQNGSISFIEDVQVVPSTRRFDQWGLWRTLIWTNPLFILMFRRRKRVWRGWYKGVPR
ncbi:MAG TPA: glycosyltransferase [Blastocatellia bacterium]|nr:glycosyltransferase [Blastocatellia bacterium]